MSTLFIVVRNVVRYGVLATLKLYTNAPVTHVDYFSHDQKLISPQINVLIADGLMDDYTHAMHAQNVGQIIMKLANVKKVL